MNIINKIDNIIIHFIDNNIKNKYLDILMINATRLGNYDSIWIMTSIILVTTKEYRSLGYQVIIAMLLCALLGEIIIKHLVKRVRPYENNKNLKVLISKPRTYSFPSGHSMVAFACSLILSQYFNQYAILFLLLAVLISFSRIYLYVHYFSDVLVGIFLGLLCAIVVLMIYM